MLVEIYAGNYDSQGGLVNGADGIIKAYVKLDNFDVIWIKFYDERIGRRQAHIFYFLYSQQICKDWTPILRTTKPVSVLAKTRKLKIRKQFPSQLACACTIHRSQGLTLDNLAFYPLGIRCHGLVYTTLSRVGNIESLYFLSPLKKQNFRIQHKISLEMERLQRNTKWQLDYNYSLLEIKAYISILSLNTHSLQIHIVDLLNDYDLMQSDILCLQETHLTQPMLLKRLEEFNFKIGRAHV